ncbi:hypothetical protein D3C76_1605100 [compost metagenome]
MAGVDVHLVGGRVLLQQGLLPFGQVRLVLAHVLRGDHQDRLLRRIGIHRLVAGEFHMIPARYFTQVFAGVRRNGALGVASLLGADTGQLLAQLGRFLG